MLGHGSGDEDQVEPVDDKQPQAEQQLARISRQVEGAVRSHRHEQEREEGRPGGRQEAAEPGLDHSPLTPAQADEDGRLRQGRQEKQPPGRREQFPPGRVMLEYAVVGRVDQSERGGLAHEGESRRQAGAPPAGPPGRGDDREREASQDDGPAERHERTVGRSVERSGQQHGDQRDDGRSDCGAAAEPASDSAARGRNACPFHSPRPTADRPCKAGSPAPLRDAKTSPVDSRNS